MISVLLDTNILLDALQERQPFDIAAKKLLLLGQQGAVRCFFTANAATDIFFLYSKARDKATAKEALSFLIRAYGVVPISQEDCLNALSLPNDDFEDALVEVCAKKIRADYIVSRDEQFAEIATEVRVITPAELFAILQNDPRGS